MDPVQPVTVPDTTVTAPALDAPVQSPASDSSPTTAIDQAVKAGDTRTYKQERHKQRQDALKGTTSPQTPLKPAKQAASTDATVKPAASEPAAPADKANKGHKRDQRVAELQSENAALEAELRRRSELRKQLSSTETPPAPRTDPKPADQPQQATRPKPSEDEIGSKYQNYGEYVEDLTDWKAEQRDAQVRQTRDQERQQRELYAKAETFDTEIATFAERVQDWKTKNPNVQLEERLLAIPTASGLELFNATVPPNERMPIGPEHFLVDEIRKSEIPGPMLAHFSNGSEFKRLYDLAVRDPRAAVRELGRIEAKLLSGPASPTVSPTARVSAVPNPPTQLGKKPAGVLDPLQKAIESGDTRAYKALRHQQRTGSAL